MIDATLIGGGTMLAYCPDSGVIIDKDTNEIERVVVSKDMRPVVAYLLNTINMLYDTKPQNIPWITVMNTLTDALKDIAVRVPECDKM